MKVGINIDHSVKEIEVLITAQEQSGAVNALYEHIVDFDKKSLETLTAYKDDIAKIVYVTDIFRKFFYPAPKQISTFMVCNIASGQDVFPKNIIIPELCMIWPKMEYCAFQHCRTGPIRIDLASALPYQREKRGDNTCPFHLPTFSIMCFSPYMLFNRDCLTLMQGSL